MSAKKLFETTFLGETKPVAVKAPAAKRVRKPKPAPLPVEAAVEEPIPEPVAEPEPVIAEEPPKKKRKPSAPKPQKPEDPKPQKPIPEVSSTKKSRKRILIQNDQVVSDVVPAWFNKGIEQALLKMRKETGEKVTNQEVKEAAKVQAEVKWEQPEIRKEVVKEVNRHNNKMAQMIFG